MLVVDHTEICRILDKFAQHQRKHTESETRRHFDSIAKRSAKLHSEIGLRIFKSQRATHLIDKQLRFDVECVDCKPSSLFFPFISQ